MAKRFTFSTKDLLFLITLIAVLLGWAVHCRTYRRYATRAYLAEQELMSQRQLTERLNARAAKANSITLENIAVKRLLNELRNENQLLKRQVEELISKVGE